MKRLCALIFFPFIFDAPAFAIDCKKAATDVEKAICASPALLAKDADLNRVYSAVLQKSKSETKNSLPTAQRIWNQQVLQNCRAHEVCIAEAIEARVAYLNGEPRLGNARSPLPTPQVKAEVGTAKDAYVSLEVLTFDNTQSAGEIAFNQWIGDWHGPDEGVDLTSENQFESTKVRLLFASDKILGAVREEGAYWGGAHGQSSFDAIYLDRITGKKLEFEDVFRKGALDILFPVCLAQADAPLDFEEGESDNLRFLVRDLGSWEFSKSGARLTFGPYSIGGYIQPIYGCDFTTALLQKLVQPEYRSMIDN